MYSNETRWSRCSYRCLHSTLGLGVACLPRLYANMAQYVARRGSICGTSIKGTTLEPDGLSIWWSIAFHFPSQGTRDAIRSDDACSSGSFTAPSIETIPGTLYDPTMQFRLAVPIRVPFLSGKYSACELVDRFDTEITLSTCTNTIRGCVHLCMWLCIIII